MSGFNHCTCSCFSKLYGSNLALEWINTKAIEKTWCRFLCQHFGPWLLSSGSAPCIQWTAKERTWKWIAESLGIWCPDSPSKCLEKLRRVNPIRWTTLNSPGSQHSLRAPIWIGLSTLSSRIWYDKMSQKWSRIDNFASLQCFGAVSLIYPAESEACSHHPCRQRHSGHEFYSVLETKV